MTLVPLTSYPPAIVEVLLPERLPPLGPGQPQEAMRPRLEALRLPDACLAGLWLYHDFLDEAHRLAQRLPTATGSFWHAIMHRREGDYDNAKYWFRRVGLHPVYDPLRRIAADLASAAAAPQARFLSEQTQWDPFRFVDLCHSCVRGQAACQDLCRQIQWAEWRLLFDHAWREAGAAPG
jgi:hypothetical protein